MHFDSLHGHDRRLFIFFLGELSCKKKKVMIVLSWNVFAQPYYERAGGCVSEVTRMKQMCHVMTEIRPHIILLQEVNLNGFETHFKSLLNDYAYIRHVVNKKRTNFMGNVTLFRNDSFVLLSHILATKSVHVKLQYGQRQLWVCNVHLTARYTNESVRVKEMQSVMSRCESDLILGGDFNDDLLNPNGVRAHLPDGYPICTEPTCKSWTRIFRADHILARRVTPIPFWVDVTTVPNEGCMSDHIPVLAKVE